MYSFKLDVFAHHKNLFMCDAGLISHYAYVCVYECVRESTTISYNTILKFVREHIQRINKNGRKGMVEMQRKCPGVEHRDTTNNE